MYSLFLVVGNHFAWTWHLDDSTVQELSYAVSAPNQPGFIQPLQIDQLGHLP